MRVIAGYANRGAPNSCIICHGKKKSLQIICCGRELESCVTLACLNSWLLKLTDALSPMVIVLGKR